MKQFKLRLRTETLRTLNATTLSIVGGGYGDVDPPSSPGRTCAVHGEITAVENGCTAK